MKFTASSRNRIAEVIVGALLIMFTLSSVIVSLTLYAPGFDFTGIPANAIVVLSIYVAASLFYVIAGAMLIFRAYRFLPMKILYCLTGLAVLASSSGGLYIRSLLGEEYFSSLNNVPPPYVIRFIAELIIIAAAIVIAFLTMNRNIVWITNIHLITYAYIAIALLVIIKAVEWSSLIVILLPTFMQESTEKKDEKGLVGNITLILMGVLPLIAGLVQNFLNGGSASVVSLLTGQASSVNSNETFTTILRVVLIILAFLTPLLAFDRECRASGMLTKKSAEKKAAH